jgi:membrane protein insertase Oxa1/YidC/SpoIIIJ
VLYWTTSNLWAIGQQALTNRLIGPTKPRGSPAGGATSEERRRQPNDQAVKERK